MTLFRISASRKEQDERVASLESRVSYLEGEVKVLQIKDTFYYDLFKDLKKEMRQEFKNIKKELRSFKK